ncbi:MAG: sugar phosphate isomerase/epimerase, partial [Eubacterium sp.]|nr:sugar phosphate isomerase/epimerase [Eubacterium sp.]
ELIDRIGRDNVGFLLDTFHMNIEESNIIAAIGKAAGKIYDFHTCANTRGIPGEDNFDWPAIAKAIKAAGYDDYCNIESFTPDCVEIAKAASVWRPFAESPEAIAEKGIPFLRKVFA